MDQIVVNTWIGERRGKRLFRSNHYFINAHKSLCGKSRIYPEDQKHLKPLKYEEVFQSKICKRCITMCEFKGINYKI